jgi:hypothetical protein
MKKQIKEAYSNIRNVMPASVSGMMTKISFFLSNKPFVKKDSIPVVKKFPYGEKGGVIISADFEMAWAWRYTKTGYDHMTKGRIERENMPSILKILEEYNIPITFATVGHLFLEKCSKGDHDWMRRIPYFDDHWIFTEGDWYEHDPYANYIDSPEWYAPDLIQMIFDSPVNHEIGTHTFSHIDFSDKNCPADVADDEIKACIDAAKPYGIDFRSIVFPGGTWGNISTLKNYNFTIYRKREEWELAYPYRDNRGLLVTPSSGSLEYNVAYGWSAEYFIRKLKKYIRKAIETHTIAHFWFHPSLNGFIIKNIFPDLFSYISQEREKGNLWIGTMRDIADHINSNKVL